MVNICIYLLRVHFKKNKDQQRTHPMMLMRCFYVFCLLSSFIKAYVVGTHLNCINLFQMSTHNICLYKVVDISTLAEI